MATARMPIMSLPAGSESRDHGREVSPYIELARDAWAALAESTHQPLSNTEIERVRGLGDELDLDEVQQVYLPLSRLPSLYVEAAGRLHRRPQAFLAFPTPPRTPFVIGRAGSGAGGKSPTSAVVQEMA